VYIETSIPCFYYSIRRSVQALAWREQTRTWWDEYRRRYDLVTSEAVLAELGRAPKDRAAPRLRMLENIPLLPIDDRLERVTRYYIEQRLAPSSPGGDALHIAYASVHAIDFLLTWNCRHIANANKARHLAVLNKRLGLPVPAMATPYTLVPEDSK
jgi:hypothetical protein